MAALVTLSSLRTQVLQRADAVNDPFFTTAEVNQYINNSYTELYDLLTSHPSAKYNLRWYYFRTTVLNQPFGVGTVAGALTFTGTLLGTTISAGSLTVWSTNGQVGADNGSGSISGPNGLTGTINYTTGAISVTFVQAPVFGASISATYVGAYGSTDTYPLPLNYYKDLGMDLQITNAGGQAQYVAIRNFMFMERNQYNYLYNPIAISILGGTNVLYDTQDQVIRLIPTPNIANLNFRMPYIPTATPMVIDSDTIDGVNGWEDYVIVDTVIKMMAKQETDTTPWDMAKAALLKRIEAMAPDRNAGLPQRVSDTVQGQSNGPFMIGGLPL